MKQATEHSISSILLKAVDWLARPLVRLLIARGITYPQFRDLLKHTYIKVAEEELQNSGKGVSDSRLFILTGVHRKDIKRLRQQSQGDVAENCEMASLGGSIMARWTATPDYLDAAGQPRCLSRHDEPGLPGFDSLVTAISKDVRPRAILDEWLRLGVVSLDDDGLICLNQQAFVPGQDFAEQSFFLARNVHDHLAACAHNMLQQDQPMLERSVYYAALSQDSVLQLQQLAQTEAEQLLQKINRRARELQQQDENSNHADYRIRFGSYWYHEKKREMDNEKD